ncbi:S-layer homology domain-containing protein [Paenibacillus kandeliae]|uniref:S-layer homology domain-containing protein n=1 Tax=Paenibacillus kandeliae TaxID=3231269 RepID=UPI00345ACBB4
MKKWMIWCLAIMIALPSAAATPVYADDNDTSTTTNTDTTSNNSTVSSDTYSTNNSSTSTENTNPSTSGGGGTVTTAATTNQPIINLIGDSSVRMKIGTTFADPGTTVQDDVYNDLSAKVTYTLNNQPVDSINTNATGTYVIHYNVTTSDDRVANEVTRTVSIVNVGDYIDLSSIYVPNAYGMTYHEDYVYVAQRETGLARVNLYSGKIETIISSNQSFMAVALDSAGNLFYTVDGGSTIYQLNHSNLDNLPLSESDFNAKKSVYFSSNNYQSFYGLTFDNQNNLYFTDFSSKGIVKLPVNSLTPQTVLSGFSTSFVSLTIDPLGNLYAGGRDSKLYRINSSLLQSLPLDANSLVNINNANYNRIYGMFFTPDGTSYIGPSFTKNSGSTLIPVITLNAPSKITVTQYDTFLDPGVTVTPSKYDGLKQTVTYTLNGVSVPSVDTSVVGTYIIHYNASISSQYVAKEVTCEVTVQPGPSQLSEVQVNNALGLAYYNGDVYYADFALGISKISTKTFKVTPITKTNNTIVVAIAFNKNGDMFYSLEGQDTIYKLDHSYVSDPDRLPLYDEDLADYSKTYYKAPLDTSNDSYSTSIKGLAFDQNDRLYFAVQMENELRSKSNIMRFPSDSATTPELVATYPARAYGLTISPLGNLYVNVGFTGLYKADASLLNNLPISATQFKSIGDIKQSYGVVFLPDLTGYTSLVETPTLKKLSFLDSRAVTSVKLNQSTLTFTEGDLPALLTASTLPANATDTQLVWKSSNEQVATVQNGIVTPVGKGTAEISVYVANQPDVSDTATITVNAKPVIIEPVIVKDDKKKTNSLIKLGVDGGVGKTYVPSTASESRSTQFDGSTLRTITFDADTMPSAINLLKSMNESTVRLNIPTIDNLNLNTDINLPVNVSHAISNNDMNLNINTNKIQLSIPSSSMLNVNQDIKLNINVLDTYKDMINQKLRAANMELVKQIVGNGDLSAVSQPIDIVTNFQNRPVDVLIPLDTVKVPSLSVVKDLYVYVAHSDGSQEFIKPIEITDDSGNTLLKINTSKFSTFTVMQVSSASTPTTTDTTPVTGTNPANTSGIVKPAYIEGYPDGTFRPNNSLTRAELASLLYRLQATSSNAGTVKSFKDVSSSFWANQAIQSMQSAGLMSGLPNGTFAPSKPLTRAEMAIILSRWQGLSGQGGTTFAKDINGHWAEREIKLVLTAGLMQGISPSSFQPNAPLTRAQAVTILNKILEKTAVLSARPTPWKDVPSSHWAYADIMEASNSYSLK